MSHINNFSSFLSEIQGYSKSFGNGSYDHFFVTPPPEKFTIENVMKFFEERCKELKKAHPNSIFVDGYIKGEERFKQNTGYGSEYTASEPIVDQIRKLLTGEEEKVPYSNLGTSTAGFQWGKEFADQLAKDGLMKVVKERGKPYLMNGLPEELAKEIKHSYRGKIMAKRFNL